MELSVETFYDDITFTLTYVVYHPKTKDAVIIDPVLDYDLASGQVSSHSIKKLEAFIEDQDLIPHLILETHAHADHISGAQELKKVYPDSKIAIGQNITLVQEVFKNDFNLKNLDIDGAQFDLLVKDQKIIEAGLIQIKAIETPGHTPACVSFLIDDMLFTGDTLFMPDYGTGRCDFPKGSAEDLYDSIHKKLYSLPDQTRVFVGHDYQPNGRELKFQTTIEESKRLNVQLKSKTQKNEFVKFRKERDASLSAPKLLWPSIQVNINAGRFPIEEDNGQSYLKLPVKRS